MQSVSNGTPKALMSVGNKVYLDLLLDRIFSYQIEHVYLSLYYKPELFASYLKNCYYRDRISVIIEPQPLGTGSAVNYVIQNSNISSGCFCLLCIMIPSLPASIYAFALSRASSIPVSNIRLSILEIIIKSSVTCALFAAAILF